MHRGMLHEKKIASSLQSEMVLKRRIEPTPTSVEVGIKIDLVTCVETLRSTSRQLLTYAVCGLQEDCYSNCKRFHFRNLKFVELVKLQKHAFLKQSKCVCFDNLLFWSSLLGQFSLASRGCFSL